MGSACAKIFKRRWMKSNKICDNATLPITDSEKQLKNPDEFTLTSPKKALLLPINGGTTNASANASINSHTLYIKVKNTSQMNTLLLNGNSRANTDSNKSSYTNRSIRDKPSITHIEDGEIQYQHQQQQQQQFQQQQQKKLILDYKKGHLIGKGTYGQVYECLNMNSGELLAVKNIKLTGRKSSLSKSIESLKKEILSLKTLNHKNIVKYYTIEINQQKNEIDIILEYVSGGSLRQILDKFHKLDEKVISLYTKQILYGLSYLHDNHIIHGDIKGANVLIDANGTIKLSDFGYPKQLLKLIYQDNPRDNSFIILPGSQYWMAPETIMRNIHSKQADIWSVGCVVLEMLTGIPPWSDITHNIEEVYNLISLGELPKIPNDISDICQDFLMKIFKFRPKDRLSAIDLLNHTFIKDGPLRTRDDPTTNIESISQNVIENGIPISFNIPNLNNPVQLNENKDICDSEDVNKLQISNLNTIEGSNNANNPEDLIINSSIGSSISNIIAQQKKTVKNGNNPSSGSSIQALNLPMPIPSELKTSPIIEKLDEIIEDDDNQISIYEGNNAKTITFIKSYPNISNIKSSMDLKCIDMEDSPQTIKLHDRTREDHLQKQQQQQQQRLELERIKAEKRKKWEEELKMELERQKQIQKE